MNQVASIKPSERGLVVRSIARWREEIQVRVEAFNAWNPRTFASRFDTNVSSPTFGMWNGTASAPRNIRLGARLMF